MRRHVAQLLRILGLDPREKKCGGRGARDGAVIRMRRGSALGPEGDHYLRSPAAKYAHDVADERVGVGLGERPIAVTGELDVPCTEEACGRDHLVATEEAKLLAR